MAHQRPLAMLSIAACLLAPTSLAQADPSATPTPVASATSTSTSTPSPHQARSGLPSRFLITRAIASDTTSTVDSLGPDAAAVGSKVVESRTLASGDEVVILDQALDVERRTKFLRALEKQPGVLRAEVDTLLQPLDAPASWALASMKLTGPASNVTGQGTTIAVIDTGIVAHPQLRTTGGYDFISDADLARDHDSRDQNPADPGDWRDAQDPACPGSTSSSWHGTQVAGVIGSTGSTTSAGIAPGATVVPVRALGRCGGYTSDVIDAVLWSAGVPVRGVPTNDHPAHVITMAFGGEGSCATSLQNALNQAVAKGVTIVAAAGQRPEQVTMPANCSNVLSVGATTASGTVASYSPTADVNLFAPGGDASTPVVTTSGQGPRELTGTTSSAKAYGTSIAAAYTAGAVALLRSARPQFTPGQIEGLLIRTSTSIAGCSTCRQLDVKAALAQAQGSPTNPGSTSGSIPSTTPLPGSSPSKPASAGDPNTPSTNVILNGTFEAGAKGWRGDTGIIQTNRHQAASGRAKAWFLGYGRPGAEQISQPVAIPAGSKQAVLSFALSISSEETKPYASDTMVVRVFDWNGRYLSTLATYTNADKATGYALKNLDMSQYIGQKIQIQFGAVEDRSLRTSFLLDDVALKVT